MTNIPIAIQLYTLREETKKDFAGTLQRIAEIGFDGVEFAGFEGLDAQEVKELLDRNNLKAASSHISLEELKNNLNQVINDQKIIGSKYVVCPYLAEDQRSEEDYQSLISFLDETGEKLKAEGITLCYHNHDFELQKLQDGRTALESIFNDTNAENLHTELDVYWLTKVEEDPVEWLNRYKGRTPLVHLKDMTTDDEKFFAELGTGGVEIDAILELGNELNVEWWIVEQDVCRRPVFESIERSFNYLKRK